MLIAFLYALICSFTSAPNYVVESELEYVVPARAVRIYPYNHISFTCMRVEAYGAYITKPMCTHAGIKPTLIRNCIGSRDCGRNSECVRTTDVKGTYDYYTFVVMHT